jgi:hypothetical protein
MDNMRHMHSNNALDALRGQSSTPIIPVPAALSAPKPLGLSQAELRRIVLDLLG